MFRKFAVRMFSIIFIPLVACQLPNGQVIQATDVPISITESTVQPTSIPANEVALQFETIELREPAKPNYWQDKNPGLLLIASPEDIAKASQYITEYY